MLSIDEVITALEQGPRSNIRDDAVTYLTEYKGLSKMWNDKLDMEQQNIADAYMLYKIALEKEKDNPPLTWEELKQMKGKPVWIEFLNDGESWNGEWCLVESSNNLICEILRCQKTWWGLRKITLGKTWKVYRKERK